MYLINIKMLREKRSLITVHSIGREAESNLHEFKKRTVDLPGPRVMTSVPV